MCFQLFGSTKRKLGLPLEFEFVFHHPCKVNHSIPYPATRTTRVGIEESFKHDENVVSHITNVLGIKVSRIIVANL